MEELKNKDKIIKDLDFALKCADAVNRELHNNIAAQEINIRSIAIELAVYKKALEIACEELETHPYSQWNKEEWLNYFSQKAREEE